MGLTGGRRITYSGLHSFIYLSSVLYHPLPQLVCLYCSLFTTKIIFPSFIALNCAHICPLPAKTRRHGFPTPPQGLDDNGNPNMGDKNFDQRLMQTSAVRNTDWVVTDEGEVKACPIIDNATRARVAYVQRIGYEAPPDGLCESCKKQPLHGVFRICRIAFSHDDQLVWVGGCGNCAWVQESSRGPPAELSLVNSTPMQLRNRGRTDTDTEPQPVEAAGSAPTLTLGPLRFETRTFCLRGFRMLMLLWILLPNTLQLSARTSVPSVHICRET